MNIYKNPLPKGQGMISCILVYAERDEVLNNVVNCCGSGHGLGELFCVKFYTVNVFKCDANFNEVKRVELKILCEGCFTCDISGIHFELICNGLNYVLLNFFFFLNTHLSEIR